MQSIDSLIFNNKVIHIFGTINLLFHTVFHTSIIVVAEKHIGVVARPPIDTVKPVGFIRRILILQPEKSAELLMRILE
jgi:hypothetical protein